VHENEKASQLAEDKAIELEKVRQTLNSVVEERSRKEQMLQQSIQQFQANIQQYQQKYILMPPWTRVS
jgi:ribosome recycling factor